VYNRGVLTAPIPGETTESPLRVEQPVGPGAGVSVASLKEPSMQDPFAR
jgi:hypothetical protein